MKLTLSDIKSKFKLGPNGSPVFAVILFVVAFSATLLILGGDPSDKVDSLTLGQQMKQIVESEPGEVVATINDVNYFERDLAIIKHNMLTANPQYSRLPEKQQNQLAGDQLVRQYMILQEFSRFNLSVTDEECEARIQTERKAALDMIADGKSNGENFLKYIEGYGCTFDEYWQDEAVRSSFIEALKYDKAIEKICDIEGKETMTNMEMNTYLTELINNDVYKITLFGEPFGKKATEGN